MQRGLTMLIAVLTLLIGQAAGQESAWSVWLYDAAAGRAVQVDNAGVVLNDITLPVPALYAHASYDLSRGLAVSRDGTRLAYSINGEDATGAPVATLLVYDVPTEEDLTFFQPPLSPLADALSLAHDPNLFNLTGSAVAYSYAAGDTPETQLWQLVVLDIFSGTAISELNNTHPAIAQQDFQAQVAPLLVPAVLYYEGATVSFSMAAFGGMAIGQEFDNFAWDVITGRVMRSNQFPNLAGDYLPRIGESVVPLFDDGVTLAEDFVPYANALHVFRPEIGGRVPFFASNTLDILRADFVQNGERVVIQGESLQNVSGVWMLIERSGTARVMPVINAYERQIAGIPDGFVYVADSEPQVVIQANTRSAAVEQTPLWVAPAGSRFVPVWATQPEPSTQYAAWAQLAPPVFAAQTVIVPEEDEDEGILAQSLGTATPSGRGVLTVNAVALVSTTEGDRLNMRSAPALSGAIVARLENGTRVVLLDGPAAGDGFTWWQVRLNTGQVGWVVESADGVKTLIPAG